MCKHFDGDGLTSVVNTKRALSATTSGASGCLPIAATSMDRRSMEYLQANIGDTLAPREFMHVCNIEFMSAALNTLPAEATKTPTRPFPHPSKRVNTHQAILFSK